MQPKATVTIDNGPKNFPRRSRHLNLFADPYSRQSRFAMPKAAPRPRHNPLSEDYIATDVVKPSRNKKRKSVSNEEDGEAFIDAQASRKILKIGRDLVDEDEAERKEKNVIPTTTAFELESRFAEDLDEAEAPGGFEDDEAWGDEEEMEEEEVEIDPNDLEAFNKFNPSVGGDDPIRWPGMAGEDESDERGPGTDLAALILEKIAMHEARQVGDEGIEMRDEEEPVELPERVVEVYTQYVFNDTIVEC